MKNKFFKQRSFYAVFLSVILSVVLVAGAAGAATTISANITTGGTLTVSGLTSLNGNANVGDATSGDNDLVYLYGTTTVIGAQSFVLGSSTATELSGQAEGAIFYSSADNLIRLYNGTSWIIIASSTSGSGGLINTSDKLVLFGTVATGYMALGTTTGFATNVTTSSSVLTVQATTTSSIPLTVFGPEDGGGTVNLFEILSGLDGSELFAIDENGQASTTASFQIGADNTAALNGDLYVSGMATTTGASGNIATEGTFAANGAVTLGNAITDILTINGSAMVGTTTPPTGGNEGGAQLTVTASTTAAVPLKLFGLNAQTGDLFGIFLNDSTEYFSVDAYGNASTSNSLTVAYDLGANSATQALFVVGGYATTTASSGDLATAGSVSVGTSTVPAFTEASFDAFSAATTTIRLGSSSATQGGCIEITGIAGSGTFHIVASTTGPAIVEAGSCDLGIGNAI